MARSAERQARIDLQRELVIAAFPQKWERLITEWNSPAPEDRGWLMYSANYLFRTGGVRWAIDPLEMHSRLTRVNRPEAARDLRNLDFVLLTHRHSDHLDLNLLRTLRDLPIQWVVPEAILPLVRKQAGLAAGQILVPETLQTIELHGFRITPFDGLHWEDSPTLRVGWRGVAETGYLVELGDKRWLFPGDTRNYDAARLPAFGEVDILFAHLWLGRGAALKEKPPLLEEFCRFCLALQPRQVILTHLEEWGRGGRDFWDREQAGLVIRELNRLAPSLPVEVAFSGDEIPLEDASKSENSTVLR